MRRKDKTAALACLVTATALIAACGGDPRTPTQPELDNSAQLTAAGNGNGGGRGGGGGGGGGDSLAVAFTKGIFEDLVGSGTIVGEIKRSSKKGTTVKAGAVIGGGSPAGTVALTILNVRTDPNSVNPCNEGLLEGKTFTGGFSLEVRHNVPRKDDRVHFLLADHDVAGVGNIRVQSGVGPGGPTILDDGTTLTIHQGAGARLTTTDGSGDDVTCGVGFTMTVGPA